MDMKEEKLEIIDTPRLRIVPFTKQHLTERYVSWLNDPIVTRFSDQARRSHTLTDCRSYLLSFDGTPHRFWALESKNDAEGHIGNMNAYIDEFDGVADIGILIGERSLWGKGYGLEAWLAVCTYLFNRLGLRKVTAGCLAVNAGMIRLMEKAGMVEDGIRYKHKMWEGQPVDVVHRALFRT